MLECGEIPRGSDMCNYEVVGADYTLYRWNVQKFSLLCFSSNWERLYYRAELSPPTTYQGEVLI